MKMNLTPKAEGLVPAAQADQVRDALAEVLEPLFDFKLDGADALEMATKAVTKALPAVHALDGEDRIRVGAAALGAIAAQLGMDLVAIYPEEEAGIEPDDVTPTE